MVEKGKELGVEVITDVRPVYRGFGTNILVLIGTALILEDKK